MKQIRFSNIFQTKKKKRVQLIFIGHRVCRSRVGLQKTQLSHQRIWQLTLWGKVECSKRVISKIHYFVELNHWFVELNHWFVELNHWFVQQNCIKEFGSLLCEESGTFEKGYFKNSLICRTKSLICRTKSLICRTKSLICPTKLHQRIWQLTLRGERLNVRQWLFQKTLICPSKFTNLSN